MKCAICKYDVNLVYRLRDDSARYLGANETEIEVSIQLRGFVSQLEAIFYRNHWVIFSMEDYFSND